jgi:hypothetical protein
MAMKNARDAIAFTHLSMVTLHALTNHPGLRGRHYCPPFARLGMRNLTAAERN